MNEKLNKIFEKALYWGQKRKNTIDKLFRTNVNRLPRPDFSQEDVEFVLVNMVSGPHADESNSKVEEIPCFTRIKPMVAQQNGWLNNLWEYEFLAGMTFANRFPNHPYSQQLRSSMPDFTDEVIDSWGKGTSRVEITKDQSSNLNIKFYSENKNNEN